MANFDEVRWRTCNSIVKVSHVSQCTNCWQNTSKWCFFIILCAWIKIARLYEENFSKFLKKNFEDKKALKYCGHCAFHCNLCLFSLIFVAEATTSNVKNQSFWQPVKKYVFKWILQSKRSWPKFEKKSMYIYFL